MWEIVSNFVAFLENLNFNAVMTMKVEKMPREIINL